MRLLKVNFEETETNPLWDTYSWRTSKKHFFFLVRKWFVLYCQVGRWLGLLLVSIFGIFGGLNPTKFEAHHTWLFPYVLYSKVCCLHLFFSLNFGGEQGSKKRYSHGFSNCFSKFFAKPKILTNLEIQKYIHI